MILVGNNMKKTKEVYESKCPESLLKIARKQLKDDRKRAIESFNAADKLRKKLGIE